MKYWEIDFDFSEKQKNLLRKFRNNYLMFALFITVFILVANYVNDRLSWDLIYKIITVQLFMLAGSAFDIYYRSLNSSKFFQRLLIYLFDSFLSTVVFASLMLAVYPDVYNLPLMSFLFFNWVIANSLGWVGAGLYYKTQKERLGNNSANDNMSKA